ncbi:Ufm1-specific protease 2, variant 2 [Balamuthia mandrillaris]
MEREAPEPTGNGLVRNLHRYLRDDRDAEEGLEHKGSNGVETAVVKGDYDFYHFGHKLNDMGWGCAYRSFQTLCSWFVLQRHPNFVTASASGKEQALVAVPSHKKVQETLFRIGDKPIHFIGSREWIGSYELCLCFDAMFNVRRQKREEERRGEEREQRDKERKKRGERKERIKERTRRDGREERGEKPRIHCNI